MRPRLLTRIDRYLIAKFLGTYFFSIFLIISIAVVFDFNENVDKFTTNHATWHAIIFQYYLNFIPYFTNLFSALFVFLSVIFFTTKLADNSEIIAMLSAGVSFGRLWRPYLICSALIAAMSFYLGAEVIPKGSVRRLAFENQYKRNKKNPTYADNVQLQVDTGVIAFMEHFDGISKTGTHFSLDKFKNKKLISHLTATSVEYDTLSDVRYHWRLNNVTIRELRGLREHITHHVRMDSIITMEPQDFLFIRNQQETMTIGELREYIEKQKNRGSGNLKAFEVEYHKRFAIRGIHPLHHRHGALVTQAKGRHGTLAGRGHRPQRKLYPAAGNISNILHQRRPASGPGRLVAKHHLLIHRLVPICQGTQMTQNKQKTWIFTTWT